MPTHDPVAGRVAGAFGECFDDRIDSWFGFSPGESWGFASLATESNASKLTVIQAVAAAIKRFVGSGCEPLMNNLPASIAPAANRARTAAKIGVPLLAHVMTPTGT